MIKATLYTKEPYLVENYEEAVTSPEIYVLHHKEGIYYNRKELILNGKYYGINHENLVYLTQSEHVIIHKLADKILKYNNDLLIKLEQTSKTYRDFIDKCKEIILNIQEELEQQNIDININAKILKNEIKKITKNIKPTIADYYKNRLAKYTKVGLVFKIKTNSGHVYWYNPKTETVFQSCNKKRNYIETNKVSKDTAKNIYHTTYEI